MQLHLLDSVTFSSSKEELVPLSSNGHVNVFSSTARCVAARGRRLCRTIVLVQGPVASHCSCRVSHLARSLAFQYPCIYADANTAARNAVIPVFISLLLFDNLLKEASARKSLMLKPPAVSCTAGRLPIVFHYFYNDRFLSYSTG